MLSKRKEYKGGLYKNSEQNLGFNDMEKTVGCVNHLTPPNKVSLCKPNAYIRENREGHKEGHSVKNQTLPSLS